MLQSGANINSLKKNSRAKAEMRFEYLPAGGLNGIKIRTHRAPGNSNGNFEHTVRGVDDVLKWAEEFI